MYVAIYYCSANFRLKQMMASHNATLDSRAALTCKYVGASDNLYAVVRRRFIKIALHERETVTN